MWLGSDFGDTTKPEDHKSLFHSIIERNGERGRWRVCKRREQSERKRPPDDSYTIRSSNVTHIRQGLFSWEGRHPVAFKGLIATG
ncbi:MAG: hypothetical protein PHD11_06865 [Bacteroidales bacterium]|nr:hypothetical protein [Bacteroidales bacterium]MDD4671053.1 hypothetical protein [Bacteroidales bacterium]